MLPRVTSSPVYPIDFSSDEESIVVEALQRRACRPDAELQLGHCSRLREIVIHSHNYCQCSTFALSNLPQLRTLVVEDSSFYNDASEKQTGTFTIRDCPSLASIAIGDSFCYYALFSIASRSHWGR